MGTATLIGPYHVLRELGRGGMGVVYLAHDDRLDRQVAIKTLPEEVVTDEGRLARLKREARVVAQLNHPHIAQIHHLLEDEGALYLVLEYVPGRSLGQRIAAEGALPVEETIRLCRQIAGAVEAAHARGIIHRDLKPDNIQVTDDGTAKVLDFGIALAVPARDPTADLVKAATTVKHGATAPRASTGTPGYMAPEQARGEQVDARADVFSFGCVLYECLTGEPAIEGRTHADLIAATLTSGPDFARLPDQTPDTVRTLVRRCLERETAERLHDIGDARILLAEAWGSRPSTPAVAAAPVAVPNNLAQPRDRFIGRGRELAELSALLSDARLITLTGSGGCGKTRLAVETARRVIDRFPDGVYIAELAPTTNPDLVPVTLASAVGLNEQHGRTMTQTLVEHLGSKRMLVILDNCEHVLETSRALVSSLLDATAHLRIVTTSREALAVPGERTWQVPSLSVPPQAPRRSHTPGSVPATTPSPASATPGTTRVRLSEVAAAESVLLFVDRARAVRPAFELLESNAAAIASICRRLNGIPLAIELAAARTKVLAPEQIEKHLDDRFRLLKGGRGSMERHQTLRATVDWSYRLLTDDEQRMLRGMSVFSGAFTLDAATAVCGPGAGHEGSDLDVFEVLDLLTHLADKSLLIVDDAGVEARYRMLETIIQYAAEKLDGADETARMRDRHLDFFLARATEAETALVGPEQATWQRQLQAEVDDILHAMAWGAAAGPSGSDEPSPATKSLTLCACLDRFWAGWPNTAIRAALHAALDAGRSAPPTVRATALVVAGDVAMRQGDIDTARSLLEQALDISRDLDDQIVLARIFHALGAVAHLQGNLDEARELMERALSINRERGDADRVAGNLVNLGLVARDRGDLDGARGLYEDGLAIFREQGDRNGIAVALSNLAPLLRDQGDHAGARAAAADSLAMGSEMGLDHLVAEMLEESAILAILAGEPEPAARFLGAAGVLYDRTGGGRYAYVQRDLEKLIPQARDALHASTGSDASWERVCTEGAQLPTGQAVEEALAWLHGQKRPIRTARPRMSAE